MKIWVIKLSDCDGYTSAVVLINYLNILFPSFVQNNISYRLHEGKQHGLIPDTIPKDVKLIICPDSSSNDYEEHKYFKENGVDVLVIDHHEAEKVSEYACVINNQLCDYPTKSLSGVGMVYKFCCYLDSLLNKEYANTFLDLTATGLIADMMDLRDFETKRLIEKGLQDIKNPFLQMMVAKQEYSLGENITPIGIAFYIAPYINAITRSGTLEEKMLMFESMIEYKAFELIPSTKRGCKGEQETRVEQACRTCVNVKNRQTKARDVNLALVEKLIEDNNLLANKIIVVILPKEAEFNRNLNGLIANQLMSKYQRPVLILNQTERDDIKWLEGSGRNFDKGGISNLRSTLESYGNSDVCYCEGHESAFGFGICQNLIEDFITWSNNKFENIDFTAKYDVDFIYQSQLVKGIDILNIASYKELWGQGISEPFVVIENVNITKNNIALMKRNTLKITLPNEKMSFIKFGSSEEEYEKLCAAGGCTTINIVGTCEINSWDNSPQIKIVDYEIVRQLDYYF